MCIEMNRDLIASITNSCYILAITLQFPSITRPINRCYAYIVPIKSQFPNRTLIIDTNAIGIVPYTTPVKKAVLIKETCFDFVLLFTYFVIHTINSALRKGNYTISVGSSWSGNDCVHNMNY